MSSQKTVAVTTMKKQARIIGILFIIGTIAGVAGLMLVQSSIGEEYLTEMAAQENQVLLGDLCIIIMAVACASIGIMLYPVLRKYSIAGAFGAAGFRIIEGAFELLTAFLMLGLLTVSREFVSAGMPEASSLPALGAVIQTIHDLFSNVIMVVPWCVAALFYYYLFYRHQLVPRWLSIWGITGIILMLIDAVGMLFGIIEPNSTLQTIIALPIAVQEMVLAVWLIVKGFNPSAVASGAAKVDMNSGDKK